MENITKLDTETDLPKNFYLNNQIKELFDIVENKNKHFLLTGKAGTGKSTFIEYLRINSKKKLQILAFTGIAALKGKGRTIHSFFELPHRILNKKKDFKVLKNNAWINKLDLIIVDEVSMVRADLIDAVDQCLRINRKKDLPFGGVQMLFAGDVFQMPPIINTLEKPVLFKYYPDGPYFFNSKSYLKINPSYIEFRKVYRQKDKRFVEALEDVRRNRITPKLLNYFNQRVVTNFNEIPSGLIILAPTNLRTYQINNTKLNELNTQKFAFEATISGNFNISDMPTERNLELKVGAQVMMIKNDRSGRWVNGTLAYVVKLNENTVVVKIGNKLHQVEEDLWEKWDYKVVEKKYEPKVIGTFTQYPIKLAWAATIHKCQGQTFENAVIDFDSGAFSHGMVYVALSRVKSLNGLFLIRALEKHDVVFDQKINKFVSQNELLL